MLNILPAKVELLKTLAFNGPFTAMPIWVVLFIFPFTLRHVLYGLRDHSVYPKQAFVMTFTFGLLCACADYYLIPTPYELWMVVAGTVITGIWMLLGVNGMEGSSDQAIEAYFWGGPVGTLVTGIALILFG